MSQRRKPLLLFVRGLPGSGKTTVTDTLAETPLLCDAEYLDPDRVNKKQEAYLRHVSKQPADLSNKTVLYRFLLTKAIAALQTGRHVVWEQPWSWAEGIEITLAKIRNALGTIITVDPIIIELTVEFEKATERVSERYRQGEHTLNPAQFKKLFQGGLESCESLDIPVRTLDATQCIDKVIEEAENFIQTLRKRY